GVEVCGAGVMLQGAVEKEHRLAGAARDGWARLFDIGRLGGAKGIEPSAATFRTADAAEPAHYEEAFVLRRAAPVAISIVSSLSPDPDPIEVGGFPNDLIAALVEIVVPLRVFDDQTGLGVNPACRPRAAVLATRAPSTRNDNPPRSHS